jgi:predicted RND superfamily exporter protein
VIVPGSSRRLWVTAILIVVSALAAVAVTLRLRLDPNVATLLPERGEAAALRTYLRAFGGSDLSLVLVSARGVARAEERSEVLAADVERATKAIATELEALDSVERATAALEPGGKLDPMLAWRHADGPARARLAQALSPAGMRQRLRTSRAMLLAPGGGSLQEQIVDDPLRLVQLLREGSTIGSGFTTQADGSFGSDDGLVRLVLVFPAGQSLRGEDAKAFVRAAEGVLARQRQAFPELSIGLTGGHAIAEATERMLTRDLTLSGSMSLGLASLAFALLFRRLRALVAVMPPLFLGTLWTAGIAASLPSGLSAIAVAFMSVVIGVGVDTGVHVYAALLEARRAGLAPAAAAEQARKRTQRPVLVAAITAAAAFGALALSEIGAVRQLGILCAGGELLTAIAIVVVTPAIGARLERGPPPPHRPARWTRWVSALTRGRTRALVWLVLAFLPLVVLAAGYLPSATDAVIAMRPKGLAPLEVQQAIYDELGGRPGQWVVLIRDRDGERARERADRVAEALARAPAHLESLDALTSLLPADATQRQRFAERDALDLAKKADELERALEEVGFRPVLFEETLERMRKPPSDRVTREQIETSDAAIMLSRYLGHDADDTVVAIYLLPRLEPGDAAAAPNREHEEKIIATVHDADPEAVITGYSRLEASLKASLATDLPRIGAVAALLVLLALAASLRRPRDVALALAVVVIEIAVVLFLVRLLAVPLHAYDALVLPVLLGITVDEAMFLIHRAREEQGEDVVDATLEHEGPPVATTALTTAAGFGGLIACDFDGLRHLGMVGCLGSLAGLVVALVVVPAGLRLSQPRPPAGLRLRPSTGMGQGPLHTPAPGAPRDDKD